MKKIILFFLFIFLNNLWAAEGRYLGRSPRGLLMGDAYTAIATDDYTLYYNPALLARHKGLSFWPFDLQLTVTNALADKDKLTNVPSDPNQFADNFYDFPIHLGTSLAPGLKMARFGFTAIINNQINLNVLNKITPALDVDYRFDKGFIFGFGIPLSGNYSEESGGEQFSLGVGIKYLQRESIFGSYNLTSTSMLNALSGGELSDVLNSLGKVKGSGLGIDLGFDWVKSQGPSTYMASLALLDVSTRLKTDANEDNRKVQEQRMQMNLGFGYQLEVASIFDLTLSADLRNIHKSQGGSSFAKNLKLGAEFGLSALSILIGSNSGQQSYGIKTSLGFLDIYLGYFGLEVGEKIGQQRSSQIVTYFSLFDFEFDP